MKVINFFGGPGTGKSTLAARVFSAMKVSGYDVELVTEFTKDLVWDRNYVAMTDQAYIFGNQHHRLWRISDKVDYAVTDAPLLLSAAYSWEYGWNTEAFRGCVLDTFDKYDNVNFLIERGHTYPVGLGRRQNEDSADKQHALIVETLDLLGVDYHTIYSTDCSVHEDVFRILGLHVESYS